ncbi:MAG TPA: FGGY-family carbohydrate kinase [Caproiciproducens sp.]|nr:FGGY-family carbohydrate kinase [Caproiciproducens sp.]
MKKYAIGLDNGGTVCKAALFDLQGQEIAVASRQTPVITPRPGYNERDMETIFQYNCNCIREVLEKSEIHPQDIIGIAVCGHGKGLYAWGKDNKPALNGILSTDNRAWQYPFKWSKDGIDRALYPLLCQKLIPCQQAALLAWLKDNNRKAYDNIQWVFSIKDYIRFRLTGEAYSEATDLSGSGLMNVRDAKIDRQILQALGIEEVYEKIAPIRYSYENCGKITAYAAELSGLPEGTPVAGGMFDIDACAIAMDISSPSQLCTISGTWSINEFISKTPVTGTQIAMNSLYAIPGYYLLEECSATSAGNLEWVIKNCVNQSDVPENKRLYDYIDELAASVNPKQCDVYYLPFLYGSNTHTLAKACFVGLTTYHTKAHMLRAVYEGVAYSHKTHILRLLSAREAPRSIRMAGGAVNSPFWVQLFADVLGFPIETVSGVKELGALGCAMAAAVAAGVFADYTEAASVMVRVNAPVMPNMEMNRVYEEKFKKYTAVCRSLNTVWDKFSV